MENVHYVCAVCAATMDVRLERISCDCGGVLDLESDGEVPTTWDLDEIGLARYGAQLAVDREYVRRASLGLARTPMVSMAEGVWAKCDFISPSGSFKDRGAQVLAALALSLGASRVVLDSSGNAGAAMAAHCARAGLDCTVVVPASAPEAKLMQSRSYGATVIGVDGERSAATATARLLAEQPGTFYASHVENPFFLEGTKTWAFEVFEQLGDAPEEVVMAVGNGSLFLGAFHGFSWLHRTGLTTRMPRMVAVQARGWAPLANDVEHWTMAPLADGIAIVSPRRGPQIRAAIASSGGEVRVVTEQEILEGTRAMARLGLWVEPTSGAAWAASHQTGREQGTSVVVSLGGAGFKAPISPGPARPDTAQ